MKTAHDFFQKYLSENMPDADTLERMRQVISEINSSQKFSNISLKSQEMHYKASCIGNMVFQTLCA